MDDIRAIPHGFELPFLSLIMGLIIDEDKVPLTKGAWEDVGFIMGLRLGHSLFNNLEGSDRISDAFSDTDT